MNELLELEIITNTTAKPTTTITLTSTVYSTTFSTTEVTEYTTTDETAFIKKIDSDLGLSVVYAAFALIIAIYFITSHIKSDNIKKDKE